MAETIQTTKIKVFGPLVLMLFILLFSLAGVLGAVSYLDGTLGGGPQSFQQRIDEVIVLTDQIAIGTEQILTNQKRGAANLSDAVTKLDKTMITMTNLDSLAGVSVVPDQHKSKVNELASIWSTAGKQIKVIQAKQKSVKYLANASTDISITLSAMQQETEEVVKGLLQTGAPAGQVTWAQRLTFFTERISHGLSRILMMGSENNLGENLSRDIRKVKQALDGLLKGDRSLGLENPVTNAQIVPRLTKIDELYRPVYGQLDEIVMHSREVALAKTSAKALGSEVDNMRQIAESINGGSVVSGVGDAATIKLGMLVSMLVIFILIAWRISRNARKSPGGSSGGGSDTHQKAILQLLDELADLADGDLTVQATVTESFTGAIADSINFSIDQMRVLVSKINETARKVSLASDQTRKSASNLSIASQRQAKEIADVSQAVTEMAISIDKVSSNAAESSSVAEKSVEIANKGALTVQNTIGGMDRIRGTIQETAKRIKRLGESSQEIGDIVSLINEIADQTNILSLNAAIQASMAGDAGKGFAVVADEVQRLAERSGAAAKQISALVKTIQSDTNEAVSSMEQTTTEVVQGTRLAQEAGVALGEIEGVSKSMEEIIAKISEAAGQQAVSARKISHTMKSIQEITSQTTEGTRSTATAIGNLAEMTDELRLSVTGFKLPEK